MAFTPNNITDQFKSQIGREPTDYEIKKYSTSSPQDLASLKGTFGKLNTTQSVADYMTSVGQDPSLQNRLKLYQQYGITPDITGNYYNSNIALMKALKGGQTATPPVVGGSIVPPAQTTQTTPPSVAGSIAGAVTPTAEVPSVATETTTPNTPPVLPEVSQTKDAYTTAQKSVLDVTSKIDDINKAIDSAMSNKRDEIARSGGIVDESQLRSTVLAENAPLLAERKDLLSQRTQLVGEQNIAGKAYQDAINTQKQSEANFYKQQQLDLNKEKQKTQEEQFATKTAVQQQQFEQKLDSSNIVKKAVYQDGSKIGEEFVDKTSGKKVNVNPQTQQIIGSGSSVGTNTSPITSSGVSTSKGNVTYKDFASVSDAPDDTNRNTAYPGTAGKTYGSVYEDAITYAQTGKYQKMGMSSKPPAVAYDNAVKAKASNIAASLGMTEQDLRTAYKANSAAVGKLITMKSTIASYENKAKAQVDMILNGYTDGNGKKIPSLNDSVDRTDYPAINGLFVKGKILSGDTKAQLLSNSLITFSTEYAKIMSGSTGSSVGSSDSARKEAEGLISTALSKGTLTDVLGLLQKEMDTTIEGFDKQIKETLGASSIGGGKQSETPTPLTSISDTLKSKGYDYDAIKKAYPNATDEEILSSIQ